MHMHYYVYCTCVYSVCNAYIMFLCDVIIAVPGQVDNVSITCGPVELINQCTVTWNVSVWNNLKFIFGKFL